MTHDLARRFFSLAAAALLSSCASDSAHDAEADAGSLGSQGDATAMVDSSTSDGAADPIDAPGSDAADAAPPGLTGPCDLYAAASTPCVAAHSTVRALYGAFAGKLYQVKRASDQATKDIGVLAPGGIADAAAQDAFCADTTCTISILYDQSPNGNDLHSAPGGGAAPKPDVEANASAFGLTIAGHHAYAVYVNPGTGYRNDTTKGVATGDLPEAEYMVTSGKHFDGSCCFDYGNAETNNKDNGAGHMEAVYFGSGPAHDSGIAGPWVMADLENGLFANSTHGLHTGNPSMPVDFATAMIKGQPGSFAALVGNAQSGPLTVIYDGPRPTGYDPMQKEGAIVLGIGGDNSNRSAGTFFEGCITAGFPSKATDDAVQANIVAAGYGQ